MANEQEQYNKLLEIVRDFCKDVNRHVSARYFDDHPDEIDVESYLYNIKPILVELEKIKLINRKAFLEQQLRLMPNATSQLKESIKKEIDSIIELINNPVLIDIYHYEED